MNATDTATAKNAAYGAASKIDRQRTDDYRTKRTDALLAREARIGGAQYATGLATYGSGYTFEEAIELIAANPAEWAEGFTAAYDMLCK